MPSKLTKEQQLQIEINYVNEHQQKLLSTYRGKFIVVKNKKVAKACDTIDDAAQYAIKTFGVDGGYLIREMTDETPKLPHALLYGIG